MAEAPSLSVTGKKLQRLSEDLTCRMCNKHYQDPRILPNCCHYYCLGCLTNMMGDNASITCPSCKTVTKDCGDLEQLPEAVLVKYQQLYYHHLAKLEGKEDIMCEMCLEDKAEAYCRECRDFICSNCLSSHNKMKGKFQDHQTFPLGELRSQEGDFAFPKNPFPPSNCKEHNEPFKLYCFDCCSLVCRDCIIVEHAQHHYDHISNSVASTRTALQLDWTPLKTLLSNFEDACRAITTTKDSVASQGVFVARHVHERFTAMIELMKKKEVELLKKTESFIRKKMTRLNQQEDELQAAMATVESVTDFVKSHLDLVSDEELLCVQHQLYDKMKGTKETFQNMKLSPAENANLAVKVEFKKELEKLCSENACVYIFHHRKKSHVHMAVMNETALQFVSRPKTSEDPLPSRITDAVLTSEVDESEMKASVLEVGIGLYELTYTPKCRGSHKLNLSVDGTPLQDNHHSVSVSIPPEMLGPSPVHVISGLKHPYAPMFDEKQNLLVSESNDTQVCLLKRDSQNSAFEKHDQFVDLKSSSPSGLAADKEGNVYITSAGGHSISKYSKEGTLLAFHESQGSKLGELTHPCGLAVVDSEIFVCDRNNCRVHVFKKDLTPIRTFGCQGSEPGCLQWPYDLVSDGKGHVYVTDCNNHRVQVFSKNGDFLRSFGSKGSQKGQLKRPAGITLARDGRHVYVSEYDNHRISVFQKDGTFVSSFGSYGIKDGEFTYPIGLSFDSNNFLYVCDQGNNRIQVF